MSLFQIDIHHYFVFVNSIILNKITKETSSTEIYYQTNYLHILRMKNRIEIMQIMYGSSIKPNYLNCVKKLERSLVFWSTQFLLFVDFERSSRILEFSRFFVSLEFFVNVHVTGILIHGQYSCDVSHILSYYLLS